MKMLKVILKYLTRHFYVNEDYETIFPRFHPKENIFYSSYGLTNELALVFGYSREQVKIYIKTWIKKWNTRFEFERYWNRPPILDLEEEFARNLAIEMDRNIIQQITLAADLNNIRNNIGM
jgi:hypothetical protein